MIHFDTTYFDYVALICLSNALTGEPRECFIRFRAWRFDILCSQVCIRLLPPPMLKVHRSCVSFQ